LRHVRAARVLPARRRASLSRSLMARIEYVPEVFDDFDRFFDQGMQSATPAERQNWEWRAKPYGLDSPFDVVDQITTPLLITDPEGEQATRRSASRASAGIVRRPRRSASGIRH